MRRLLSALLPILLAGPVLADPPPGYYASVDDGSPEALRRTLHEIIKGHTRFPYTSSSTDTWDILELADEFPAGATEVLDLYQNRTFAKFGGGTGPYNREHSWPNSYGFSSSGDTAYTDCHHLFICDVEYNGARGNDPFGSCEASCSTYATDVNDGAGGPAEPNRKGTGLGTSVWETWLGRRGDVARAMFYMDVRYSGAYLDLRLTDDPSLIVSSDGPVAYMGLLSTLLQWHAEDPVDDKERRRNDVVYSYQGNRNPFIDHPEWVEIMIVPVATTSLGDLKALYR